MDVIAEHRLVATYPDGGPATVCLRVGRPEPHPHGYACKVQAEGRSGWQGPTKIYGVDSWQALLLGLRFLRLMLDAEVDDGVISYRQGGEHALNIEELFALHKLEVARPSSNASEAESIDGVGDPGSQP